VELFHWSLNEIDETPMERLLPFVFAYAHRRRNAQKPGTRRVYADQVDF
jgi:hypothetical protein